jgi:hypothetical protein
MKRKTEKVEGLKSWRVEAERVAKLHPPSLRYGATRASIRRRCAMARQELQAPSVFAFRFDATGKKFQAPRSKGIDRVQPGQTGQTNPTENPNRSKRIKANQSESKWIKPPRTGAARCRGETKWREIGLAFRKSRQIKGNQPPARAFFPGASVGGHD